ncbi:amidase, partial [Nocardia sp. NPDC050789]|uniref:amidase n=1 Tax=Nocardia sp. NPDC050789 TaxID=3154841 RepID=UPI0033D3D274
FISTFTVTLFPTPTLFLSLFLEPARGSPTRRGRRGSHDATSQTADSIQVARLRAAGAIVIGKTNSPPMGAAVHTTNDLFGTTRNPWALDRSPGGSSGGSAAAVASGMVAMATAGDGGGSTRIPAALCGIVGFKPTRGRIPDGPSAVPVWPRHSCSTPMARTVADTALHLDLTVGFHRADPFSLPSPGYSYRERLTHRLRPLRIWVGAGLGVADPEPFVTETLSVAVAMLRGLGHQIVDDIPPLPDAEDFPNQLLLRQQILANYRLTSLGEEFERRRDDFEPWFADLLAFGGTVGLTEFTRYWQRRARLDAWAARVFDSCDLLLTPVTPTLAWPAEGPDIGAAVEKRQLPVSYTAVFNDTGNPAIAVPISVSPDGLPCAVQLVGGHHRDDLVLQAAYALEQGVEPLHPPI